MAHTHTPAQWLAVLFVTAVVYGAGALVVVATAWRDEEELAALPGEVLAQVQRAGQVVRIEAVALAFWAGVALSKARTISREVVSQRAPLVAAAPEAVTR